MNGLTALIIGAAIALLGVPSARAADPVLERGQYLMNGIVACGNCHTPKDADGRPIPGQELAGGFVVETPVFHAVASNITPDPGTGIGRWTDAQIVRAIREGKRPDGTTIGPPMPIEFYRSLSDNDAAALVAAIRATRPVTNRVEKSTYKIPLPDAYGPPLAAVPDPPRGDKAAYGRYLADIGHCLECHTPLVRGQRDLTRAGAGGFEIPAILGGAVVSANLTPANKDGMAFWTDAQVKTAITEGVRPDGRGLVPLMAFDWYKRIEDRDMDALIAYLRTLKPAVP